MQPVSRRARLPGVGSASAVLWDCACGACSAFLVGAHRSILPELLSARSCLPAMHPRQGETLRRGIIYVAPPDHHMLFSAHAIRLWRGPRENHARPAVDPLFRSVALSWHERAVGVVLTGALADGTAGLAAIKERGGTAVVQDPAGAAEPSMPASALAKVEVDHCLPIDRIPALLHELAAQTPAGTSLLPEMRLAGSSQTAYGRRRSSSADLSRKK